MREALKSRRLVVNVEREAKTHNAKDSYQRP